MKRADPSNASTQLSLVPIGSRPEAPLSAPGPDDFDWSTDDCVVVPPRPGVAVYPNKRGEIVIRTQDVENGGDDFAFVREDAVGPLIEALREWASRGSK